MKRFQSSKRDLIASAEALMGWADGESSDEDAMVGALVVADAIDCLRVVRAFLTGGKAR